MAGRLPSKKPVSLMIATSAARRSRLAASQASRPSDELSSSPSKTYLHVDRERPAGRQDRRAPPWRGRGSGPCRRPTRGRASGRRRRPARTAATSTGRAGRPAGRRSGRRPGPSARPRRGASRRRRPGARWSPRPRRARGPRLAGSRPATRRRAGRRGRARAGPRCSGCAGSPCSSRAARRGSRRGAARARLAWRFGQASPESIEGTTGRPCSRRSRVGRTAPESNERAGRRLARVRVRGGRRRFRPAAGSARGWAGLDRRPRGCRGRRPWAAGR